MVTKLSKRLLAQYMVTIRKHSWLYSTWLLTQKKKPVTFSIKLDCVFLKKVVYKEWKTKKVSSSIFNLRWRTYLVNLRFLLHLRCESKMSKSLLRKKKIKSFRKKRKIHRNIKIGIWAIIKNHKNLNNWLKD